MYVVFVEVTQIFLTIYLSDKILTVGMLIDLIDAVKTRRYLK